MVLNQGAHVARRWFILARVRGTITRKPSRVPYPISASHLILSDRCVQLTSHPDTHHLKMSADDEDDRRLTIIYATETGNAQHISDRISQECRRLHFNITVANMEKYHPVSCLSTVVISETMGPPHVNLQPGKYNSRISRNICRVYNGLR